MNSMRSSFRPLQELLARPFFMVASKVRETSGVVQNTRHFRPGGSSSEPVRRIRPTVARALWHLSLENPRWSVQWPWHEHYGSVQRLCCNGEEPKVLRAQAKGVHL